MSPFPRRFAARRFTRHATAAAAFAATAVVVCAPALAQNTTSAIVGRVVDAQGRPVAGAAVTIALAEGGVNVTTQTDAAGGYGARGLRPGGPYTVTVVKDGLRERREGVMLALAETTDVDVRLGAAVQQVTITGAAAERFNRQAMGAGTQLGSEQLTALASIQRSLQDYARTDPRLSQTDKERGEISAVGQNSRFNSITIDGVAVNDSFGLEANNLPMVRQPISVDAIQTVQVNLSNVDVTQKGYTGANINAVTKSGTNTLKGSVYGVYRDHNMGGDRYNAQTDSYFAFLPYKETTVGATVGGPLVKDTLFFFANVERMKSGRAQPEYGPIGSSLTNVGITQTAIDKAREIAKSKYGVDIGNVMGTPSLELTEAALKLDWTVNDRHRANLRFSRTEQSETNGGSFGGYSPTSLGLTSGWFQQKKTNDILVGQWFADWTDAFSTELKLSQRKVHSEPELTARMPAIALRFNGSPTASAGWPAGVSTASRFLNFGTEQSRHFNVLDTDTIDGYFAGTLQLKDHEVKAGADLQRQKFYNAFFQNTLGNYTFFCQNGTYSFGTVNCSTASAAVQEQAVLELFQKGTPQSYQIQVPNTAGGYTLDDGIAKWSLQQTGLFVQDTWRVTKALTVNLGVRYDQASTADRPLANAAVAAAAVPGKVAGSTVTRASGGFGMDNTLTIDGQSLLQPRLGFNLQLDGLGQPEGERRRKLQLRGALGLFQGAAANVWLSNPYSNTGMTTRIVGCGITNFGACTSALTLSVDPNAQATNFSATSTPAANVDLLQPGVRQPSVWNLNLAVDAELPWHGLVAGAEWLHKKVDSGLYYQHLNLGVATRQAPDGRDMFWTPQTYDPACFQASGGGIVTSGACAGGRSRALSNPLFNNVLMAAKTTQGEADALTLSVGRPSTAGFGWQLAYTRNRATEVSPLTSSVANSNFNSRAIYNPNEDVASNSAYLIRDRLGATATWSQAFFGKHKTTVGVFYEGRRGRPYSWTYANDMNGDAVAGNDLMYVPKAPGSGEVVFRPTNVAAPTDAQRAQAEALFWSVVDANPSLSNARGGVVGRNTGFAPWVNSFDLRVSQEVPGFTPRHKGVISFDILNVGNLIDPSWGRIEEVPFSSAGGQRRSFVNFGGFDAQGRYVYYVNNTVDGMGLRQVKGESQWAIQVTARYEF